MLNPDWLLSVHHDGSEKYVSALTPRLGETVQLRLRTGADAPISRVFLRTFPDGEQRLQPLERGPREGPAQWWQIALPIEEPSVHYRFILETTEGLWHYSAAGPSRVHPLDATDFRILADYTPAAWVMESVFYQIFPDRFANGDPGNDPRPDEWEYRGSRPATYPWGELPPEDQPYTITFYGGDLQGVLQRLNYIEQLGVNAIYLNPVFTAHSNHKYDVNDYDQVDPHLGGDAALIALSEALHARGIRYLLDIVPNHCGYWHSWFQRAREDRSAPEAEFFTFGPGPEDYAAWLGVWTLPKLNYRSQELRRRIYRGKRSVFRRWLRPPFNADGWRVDVGNMLARQGPSQLGRKIVRGIRKAVKTTRPDAYFMAENFFDATPQLQGDQWDGVMNYQGLALPLHAWLRGVHIGAIGLPEALTGPATATATLVESWRSVRAAIPWVMALQQFNVLNSHDIPRIRTIMGENDALHRLAVVVQFTYPGAPCVYYGDEIGLVDQPRVGQRACMEWDEQRWDYDLLDFYRRLIALRRTSPVLQRGGFQVLAMEEDTLAYQREAPEGRVLVIAHRGEQPRAAGPLAVAHAGISDGARFEEYFTGQTAQVAGGALLLPELSQGATVWVEMRET